MTQFVLDSFQALSSSIQTKIEEARQKFETEFVTSEFESLMLTLYRKLDEIQYLLDESSSGKDYFLISNKFHEANEFLFSSINNYAEKNSITEEKIDFIKNFSNDLKVSKIFFEAEGLIVLAGNTKDEIDKCVHYLRAYQLFREVVTNDWDNISIECRKSITDMALFLVNILLVPNIKKIEAGTSSLLSVFAKDKDLKLLKKKQLENLSISLEEISTLNPLNGISNYLPELEKLVNVAVEQTRQWIELGIDISDPCVITPLEETADKYPAIAEYCNDRLIELVKEQMNQMKNSLPDVNEEVLDEF
ncbi:MAG: hypothetical protein WBA89_27310 [Microcoleus sp.]|uniref:hypothetical protein n=1 Tax=Microcoleus sp. TaxID=44472 RepID=UPI003C783E88